MTADGSELHSTVEAAKKDYKGLEDVIVGALTKVNEAERQTAAEVKKTEQAQQEAAKKAKEAAQLQREAAQQIQEGWTTLSVTSGIAFAAVVAAAWKGIDANNRLKASMKGLDSIATGNVGNYDKIKQELIKVQDDGMIPLVNATAAYKNLLMRYQNEDTAIKMFNKVADAAAFGRQAHLSLGEAIQGTTEGLKNSMSQMTDNGGITKNLNAMWADYAKTLGKGAMSLSEAEKKQAEVNGFMEEGRFQTGDLAKLQQQLSGQMAKTAAETNLTAAAYGDALEPAMNGVNIGFQAILKGTRETIQLSPGLTAGVTTAAFAFAGLLAVASAWEAFNVGSKIAAGFEALTTGPIGLSILAISAITSVIIGYTTAASKANEENEKFFNSFNSKADELGQKAKSLDGLIKKYDDLKTKASTSKQAQAELQSVVKQISEIAPDAVTSWGDLSTSIEISGTKAKQAVKDMLEARKSLLEVALARNQYEKPENESTIKRLQPQVTKAENDLNDAQKRQQELYKKYGDQQKWFLNYTSATEKEKVSLVAEGIKKGYVSASGNVTLAADVMNQNIRDAEQNTADAAKRLENIGKPYYDAQEKLAQNNANIAELNAIVAKGYGINTVKSKSTGNNDLPSSSDTRTAYEKAKADFEAQVATGTVSLEDQIKKWKTLESLTQPKEKADYQKQLNTLNKALIDATQKAQNDLGQIKRTGLDKELADIKHTEDEELKTVQVGSEREKLTKEKYAVQRAEAQDKWDTEIKSKQLELQAALEEAQGNFSSPKLTRKKPNLIERVLLLAFPTFNCKFFKNSTIRHYWKSTKSTTMNIINRN